MQDLSVITTLVNAVAKSDEDAYKKLFLLLFPQIKRFAYCFLKSGEIAEEVASDVMITLWRKRNTLLAIDNVRVYAFVIAKNLCLNILKSRLGGKVVFLEDVSVDLQIEYITPEHILINEELAKILNQAIETLPPRCKMIFRLIKEDGLSYKEVAEIMDISSKTVDAQLVIAIRRLSACIGKEFNLYP